MENYGENEKKLQNSLLEELIKICNETKNFIKIGKTLYYLLNNKYLEIALKMGFRARKKGEPLTSYISKLYAYLISNFEIKIIELEMFEVLKQTIYLIKKKENPRKEDLKKLAEYYFKLRALKVPYIREIDPVKIHDDTLQNKIFAANILTDPKNYKETIKRKILNDITKRKNTITNNIFGYSNSFSKAISYSKLENKLGKKNPVRVGSDGEIVNREEMEKDLFIGCIFMGLAFLAFLLSILFLLEFFMYSYLSELFDVFFIITFAIVTISGYLSYIYSR